MGKLKEEYFYLLKEVSRGRLSPDQMIGFFWGSFIFSGIMFLVIYNAYKSIDIEDIYWDGILLFLIVALIIQFLLTLFFTSAKIGYKYQRFQIYFLSLVSLKISIDMYPIYFLAVVDRDAPSFMNTVGFYFLFGGIIYLILSVLRGINRVKKGHFRKGEKGLYNFKESKGYISLPFIYGFSVMGGVLANSFSNTGNPSDVILPLLFSMLIQYSIAMVWAEFYLLSYCKTRFKSFNYIPVKYR